MADRSSDAIGHLRQRVAPTAASLAQPHIQWDPRERPPLFLILSLPVEYGFDNSHMNRIWSKELARNDEFSAHNLFDDMQIEGIHKKLILDVSS